jgi:hypothetical protein
LLVRRHSFEALLLTIHSSVTMASMTTIGYHTFLKGLPTYIRANLPNPPSLHFHQPHRWLLQIYDHDKHIHYEVQRIPNRGVFEIGLHFEMRDKARNQQLLSGFSHFLIEIHATLGDSIVAEPWDKGWAKLYEVVPEEPLTETFQTTLGKRVADFISCVHPILQEISATSGRGREI